MALIAQEGDFTQILYIAWLSDFTSKDRLPLGIFGTFDNHHYTVDLWRMGNKKNSEDRHC